jgi:hypothetical protein
MEAHWKDGYEVGLGFNVKQRKSKKQRISHRLSSRYAPLIPTFIMKSIPSAWHQTPNLFIRNPFRTWVIINRSILINALQSTYLNALQSIKSRGKKMEIRKMFILRLLFQWALRLKLLYLYFYSITGFPMVTAYTVSNSHSFRFRQ